MLDANLLKLDTNLQLKLGNSKRVAILNKGKSNKFVNYTIVGFDIGIQDEGEHTTATGNRII